MRMTKEKLAWIKKLIQEDNTDKFYNDRKWRKRREDALLRDKNECQHCKAKGLYKEAEQVHHIKELKLNPSKAYALSNLISLCKACHNTLHNRHEKLNTLRTKKSFLNEERW